jgi:hypothetical protein
MRIDPIISLLSERRLYSLIFNVWLGASVNEIQIFFDSASRFTSSPFSNKEIEKPFSLK